LDRGIGARTAGALPSAGAAESVNLILNWTPTADHSPFYYAKAQGWYEKAGIDLNIEVRKGPGFLLKVGSGGSPFRLSRSRDHAGGAQQGRRRRGADEHLRQHRTNLLLAEKLWRERRGDFPGHRSATPVAMLEVMWPAFAKAAGIAPDAVSFVNVGPTAKIAALKSHTVDIISVSTTSMIEGDRVRQRPSASQLGRTSASIRTQFI